MGGGGGISHISLVTLSEGRAEKTVPAWVRLVGRTSEQKMRRPPGAKQCAPGVFNLPVSLVPGLRYLEINCTSDMTYYQKGEPAYPMATFTSGQ